MHVKRKSRIDYLRKHYTITSTQKQTVKTLLKASKYKVFFWDKLPINRAIVVIKSRKPLTNNLQQKENIGIAETKYTRSNK